MHGAARGRALLRVVAVGEHEVIERHPIRLRLRDQLEHVLVLLAGHALHVGNVRRDDQDLAHHLLAALELDEEVKSLAFSPDGKLLYTGNGNGTVYQLEVEQLLTDAPAELTA